MTSDDSYSMELVGIGRDGWLTDGLPVPEGQCRAIADAYVALYDRFGYLEPWIGYLARRRGSFVGTCGFKHPPIEGIAEIAYFTFPAFQNRGYARAMARMLISLSHAASPRILISARTLDRTGPSVTVLRRNGFLEAGRVMDPEDGEVLEWVLPATPGSG